jgi:hypothetical protein
MARITYYVVLPFVKAENGEIVPAGEGEDAPTPVAAKRRARQFQAEFGGGVAFSRTGDPDSGDFDDDVLLARFGEVPAVRDL